MNLLFKALAFLLGGILFIALMLFPFAGTLHFSNGWLLLGVVFLPMLAAGAVLLRLNPKLLEKRLNAKEKLGEQQLVIKLSALMFIAGFALAGLDYRFAWTQLPLWISSLASVLYLLGYVLYAEVLRENTWLSRTIEVQAGQQVVSTGLYGIVRHPMYSATLILFLSMPLILGSLISFLCFLIYPVIIAKRIRSEEALLERELHGYAEYKQKVKYRLIPYLW